jgi:uncharacterized protein
MVYYQRWLIAQDGETPQTSPILAKIRDYNEQDCRSTAELAAWLHQRQREAGVTPAVAEPIDPKPDPVPDSDNQRRHALAQEILGGIPDQRPEGREGEEVRVRELLGHLIEFHRREEKPTWWRRFDRMEMEESELIDDPDCLGGLTRTARTPERVKRSFAYEYSFDGRQETKVRAGEKCTFAHDWSMNATVAELDLDAGLALLVVSNRQGPPPDRLSVSPEELTLGKVLAEAVERVVSRWWATGRLPGSLEDFLFRRRPRFLRNRKARSFQRAPTPSKER